MSKEEKDKKLNEFYKTKVGEKLKNQYNIALGILFIVAGLCCMTLIKQTNKKPPLKLIYVENCQFVKFVICYSIQSL